MALIHRFKYLQSLVRATKLSKKIVVIESDDWGSERIPNKKTQDVLKSFGVDMTSNPYSRLDTLERLDDLEMLGNILKNLYNMHGKKVKITTNFILSNPDYNKIIDEEYENYYYKLFFQTYQDRDGNSTVWEKIKKLTEEGYFHPQFHGREHINVQLWLDALRKGNYFFLKAFDLGCFAIDLPNSKTNKTNLMAAFEYHSPYQKEFIEESIKDGLNIFERTFGLRSATVVAPRHVWSTELESILYSLGVNYIQSAIAQLVPSGEDYKKIYHFTGQYNPNTHINYLVRNAYFEPAYSSTIDWITKTLNKVDWAFKLHTPVILSMHRINFVGGIDNKNRDHNLLLFQKLLFKIIKKYPDVEFLTSDELAFLIQTRYVRN